MEEICFQYVYWQICPEEQQVYIEPDKDTKIKNQDKRKQGANSRMKKSEKWIASVHVHVHEPGSHRQVPAHSPQHDCVDNSA